LAAPTASTMEAMSEIPEIEPHERCAGASCNCMDSYPKPKRRQYRAEATPFSGPIAGTKGQAGTRTAGKHPGDKPLSISAQEYAEQLWRETDRSIRLDVAKHGEVKRWDWKSLRALREQERQQKKQALA
jgi:hypothetical protein